MDSFASVVTTSAPARPADAVTFARFSTLALMLSAWARQHALQSPQFRSPPRALGVTRSIRRAPGCRPIVAVRLRGRARTEVVRDMVDGLLAVNPQPGPGSVDELAAREQREQFRDHAVTHLLACTDDWSTSGAVLRDPHRPGARLAA